MLAELLRDIEQYQPLAIGVDIRWLGSGPFSPQQLSERAEAGPGARCATGRVAVE
jgi:hypothetical protein